MNVYKNGIADERQTDSLETEPEHSLFRKRYRQLSPEEVTQHDHIKDRADALAQAIGALNPGAYGKLSGSEFTGFTMTKRYDAANVTIALRNLEDAVYRAIKALTQ